MEVFLLEFRYDEKKIKLKFIAKNLLLLFFIKKKIILPCITPISTWFFLLHYLYKNQIRPEIHYFHHIWDWADQFPLSNQDNVHKHLLVYFPLYNLYPRNETLQTSHYFHGKWLHFLVPPVLIITVKTHHAMHLGQIIPIPFIFH